MHYSGHRHYWLFPPVPSIFTGAAAGNGHYIGTTIVYRVGCCRTRLPSQDYGGSCYDFVFPPPLRPADYGYCMMRLIHPPESRPVSNGLHGRMTKASNERVPPPPQFASVCSPGNPTPANCVQERGGISAGNRCPCETVAHVVHAG